MRSLRTQLWVWLLALLTGIGIAMAGSSYWIARDETNGFFDHQLRQLALNVGEGLPSYGVPSADATPHDLEDDFAIQIWSASGTLTKQSPRAAQIARSAVSGFSDTKTDHGDWRSYTLIETARTVQVSQQRAVRDELVSEAVWHSLLPIAVTIPLSWLLLRVLINMVFGRLDALAKSLADRTPNDKTLIPVAGLPSEVTPLVTSVNELLGRLQDSLAAQKQFVSDAAHELRTPLAALQLQIGNLRQLPAGPEASTRIEDLERGVRRAVQLSRQLLRLARYNEDEIKSQAAPVDLADVVRTVIAELLPLADHRHQDLGIVRSDSAVVTGDADDLRVLIGNLLENACRYSPDGGTIDVAVSAENGDAMLEICDTGPGIDKNQLDLVLQPFYRGTDAGSDGSGLGLSIAKRIAERHGARITLANRTGRQGLIARVTFARHTMVTAS